MDGDDENRPKRRRRVVWVSRCAFFCFFVFSHSPSTFPQLPATSQWPGDSHHTPSAAPTPTVVAGGAVAAGESNGGGSISSRGLETRDVRHLNLFFFLFFHYFHLLLDRLCAWPLPPHTVAPSTTAAMTPPNTTVKPVATSPPVRTLMTTNRAQARVSFSFFFFFSYFTNMYLL
jgi:hypothetical protein